MRNRYAATGCLAIAALVLAACGSSSGGSSSSSIAAPRGTTTSGSAAHAIKVGLICSCSGPFGTNIAAATNVARAWAKSVNSSGGINGRQVDLEVADDASTPGTSVTKVQSFIREHVAVIMDLSPLDAAWAKQVDAAKIPVVGGNLNSTLFYEDPNFYPAGGTNDSTIAAMVATAKQAKATSLGILYCAEAPQCAEAVKPTSALARKQGLTVPYTAAVSATAPNYTAQCLAAKQKGVAAIFVSGNSTTIAHLAKDCAQQNYNPSYLEVGTGYAPTLANNPGTKDHLWLAFATLPFFARKAPVQHMNEALDKYYPGLRNDAEAWSGFAAQAWIAGLLIEDAVKQSGAQASAAVTAEMIIKGLNAIKNNTLGGWTPPLTFSAGRTHAVDCWFTARLQDGKPMLVDHGQLTCRDGSPR